MPTPHGDCRGLMAEMVTWPGKTLSNCNSPPKVNPLPEILRAHSTHHSGDTPLPQPPRPSPYLVVV